MEEQISDIEAEFLFKLQELVLDYFEISHRFLSETCYEQCIDKLDIVLNPKMFYEKVDRQDINKFRQKMIDNYSK